MPFLLFVPPGITAPVSSPSELVPQRPTLAPWIEVMSAHATDPLQAQEWEPSAGGLPFHRSPTPGPASGLLVSLATGEETYLTAPDIVTYNSQGTDALFSRSYRSELARKGYGSPGLSPGWVHNLDLALIADAKGGGATLVYPNGAKERLEPELDNAGKPTGKLTSASGTPTEITGVPHSNGSGRWQRITVRWRGGVWVFEPQSVALNGKTLISGSSRYPKADAGNLYLLTRLDDLQIGWDERRRVRVVRSGATSVTDPLLTFDYSPTSGQLTRVTDRQRRRIDYGFKARSAAGGKTGRKTVGPLLLGHVSRMYAGELPPGPPHQVAYDYVTEGQGGAPLLSKVLVPNPGATLGDLSVVSAQIRYEKGRVAAHVDANRIEHRFTYKSLGTQLDVQDAAGNTLSSTALTIDPLGRLRAIKDERGGIKSFHYDGEDADARAAVRAGALSVVPVTGPAPVAPATIPDAPERPVSLNQYTFTRITEYDTLQQTPAAYLSGPVPVGPSKLRATEALFLNNRGVVAIKGTVSRTSGKADNTRSSLISDGKRLTPFTPSESVFDAPKETFGRNYEVAVCGLADDGSIVFGATHQTLGQGIFRAAPGGRAVCLTGGSDAVPLWLDNFQNILVNGAGDICFFGMMHVPDEPITRPTTSYSGVYTMRGGKRRSISDAVRAVAGSGDVSDFQFGFNNNGDVLVHWSTSMVYTDRIYLVGESGPRLVAQSDNTYLNVTPIALASDDSVIFQAVLRQDPARIPKGSTDFEALRAGTAILEWKDGRVRKLMEDNPRQLRRNQTAAASGGRIVFLGTRVVIEQGTRSEQTCLFVGPDAVRDRLIGPGDLLFGAKVKQVSGFTPHFNNKGQFVFQAQLDNNKTVVVRADPAVEGSSPTANKSGTIPAKKKP